MRRIVALRLVMGMAVGLLVSACGPSTPTPPDATTPAPPPLLSATQTPAPAVSSPVAPTPGVTPSPAATQLPTPTLRAYGEQGLISAVQEPTDIQLTLRTMTQLGDHLRSLTVGQPTGTDLVTTTQQTAALMAQVQQQIPQMSFTERQHSMQLEQELVSGIGHAQSIYIYQGPSTGPTTSQGTPVAVPGTPLVVIGTPMPPSPVSPPSPAQLLANDIQQLQLNAADMAMGHPDDTAITTWLTSMVSVLSTLRQLVYQLDPADLEQLSGGVAQATTAMIGAMQAYVSP